MSKALHTGTWTRGKQLVSWNFDLPRRPDETPMAAFRRATLGVVAALDGFARPRSADWTTTSAGEDAVTLTGAELDVPALAATFDAHPDACQVFFWLDLLVRAVDDTEHVIEHGASLFTELAWDDPERPGVGEPQLYAVLSLDVDLYAARTWAAERDNSALSSRNAPRLAAFLRRLRDDLGATLHDLDAESYRDQVTGEGFVEP